MDKKKQIQERILDTVLKYSTAFNQGIQMRILAAKYAKSLMALGGFHETMQELADKKRVRIEMTKTGAQIVYPVTSLESEDAKKYF